MAITLTDIQLVEEVSNLDEGFFEAYISGGTPSKRATTKGRRLFEVAKALTEEEGATAAPDHVSNEALILVAAHLKDRRPGHLASVKVASLSLGFREMGSAVRLSGARTLLSAWRLRDLPVEPEDD